MSSSNKQGFIKDCWVPRNARDILFEKLNLDCCSRESLKVLGHLFENIVERYHETFPDGHTAYVIPVDMKTRDKHFGCKNAHTKFFKPLAEQGLIRIHPFDKEKKVCYRYELPEEMAQLYKNLLTHESIRYINHKMPLVRLHDGKEKTQRFPKSNLYDQNQTPLPEVQTQAIKNCQGIQTLNTGLFYEVKLKEQAELQQRIAQGEKGLEPYLTRVDNDLMQVSRLLQKKRATRWQTLWYNSKFQTFQVSEIGLELNAVPPFGRVYDDRSLYLNITGESKALLRFCYARDHKLQFNYDLSACYLHIVQDLATEYGITMPLLDGDIKQIRKQIAQDCNLSEKTIKQIWNALTFKAMLFLPKTAKRRASASNGAVIKALREELSQDSLLDLDHFHKAYQVIYDWLKPYTQVLEKVIEAYINDSRNIQADRDGTYLVNAVGRCYPIPNQLNRQLRCKLQTHILQGFEAAFVQNLARIQDDFDYSVKILEHDGCCATGEISEEAIEKAKQRSFPSAKLEPKDNELQSEHLLASSTENQSSSILKIVNTKQNNQKVKPN